MKLTIIGTGYVGLVAGACFADAGNDVICADKNPATIDMLRSGKSPIYEPGLEKLIVRNTMDPSSELEGNRHRLEFTTDIEYAIRQSDIIFICVGTPPCEDGSSDLRGVEEVAGMIGTYANGYKIVVMRSTVPVGTGDRIEAAIRRMTKHDVDVVSIPEFLKEGTAISDFCSPDRVIIGLPMDSERLDHLRMIFDDLYASFLRLNNRIIVMDRRSAELTKYGANAMLASRLSLMNELSQIAEKVGADIDAVRIGIGSDSRVGFKFLFPGPGFGGSCFPKDIQSLIHTAKSNGVEPLMLQATLARNDRQKFWPLERLVAEYGDRLAGKCVAVWGLAFKPKTDDVRESSALVLIEKLIERGTRIRGYDPVAMDRMRERFGDRMAFVENEYAALMGADCLVVMTDCSEFRSPNFRRMAELLKDRLVIDARNLYRPERMVEFGLRYVSIGRVAVAPSTWKLV